MKKDGMVKKCIAVTGVLLVACMIFFVLSRPVGDLHQTVEKRPPLFDSPSYVELKDGEELKVTLVAKEDVTVSHLEAVLVNLDPSGNGKILFEIGESGSEADPLWRADAEENSFTVGEWSGVYDDEGRTFSAVKGNSYLLRVRAEGCEPYFMKTQPEATNRSLPFDETVETADSCISVGIALLSEKKLTFGDVFYWSYVLTALFAAAAVFFILLGPDGCRMLLQRIPFGGFFEKYGNDLFLALLFVTLCLSIYVNGYLDGINISPDSAGYLREAVNLASGNGFHYDGLAGYPESWFANWPILYPALIAAVMKISGLPVYLSSKILSMILVGILILIVRFLYKKDAWFYALCLTNTGLCFLYWYSWSELPFILFMLLFVICLSGLLSKEKNGIASFALLGLSMVLCFLTRYFGMFTFGVVGFYVLILMIRSVRDAKKEGKVTIGSFLPGKVLGLIATGGASGVFCLSYLVLNKLKNGMPSGVSRSMWWDDYGTLTDDLIKALLTEIFHVFHLSVPEFLAKMSYGKSVLFVIALTVLLTVFVIRNIRTFTRGSVLITTSLIYYGMFIVIRYFSSMDTFYFRFFAPATLLLVLGLMGPVSEKLHGTALKKGIAVLAAVLLFASSWEMVADHILKTDVPYYDIMEASWENDYAEVPENSVVIFSTLDYRSLYYRPDVVEGTIDPADTAESLKERYHGSSHICILKSDAEAMAESGIYDPQITEKLRTAIGESEKKKYCIIDN